MAEMLRRQLLDTTRGRIVSLLQGGSFTAHDIASKLGLTRSAVRVQITAMERDGVVKRVGTRPGTTRPSHLFELTPEVEQLLSKAYIPLLTELVGVFAEALPPQQVAGLLRRTGKALANELSRGKRPTGNLRTRAVAASEMLNDQLGANDLRGGRRADRDPRRRVSPRGTDRQAPRRLSGDGKPRDRNCRNARARMLRSQRSSSLLF